MSEETAGPGNYVQISMAELSDLAAPQPMYGRLIDRGGVQCPMDGLMLTFRRDVTDHVLRHHELFSSVGGLDLGNIRPLIPLNVDPPQHSKYRRVLDPLFAPKKMDVQEADITERVNHFIDTLAERGECNFTDEFAELLPSAVFLGLMGLPWVELDTLLHLRDGILRPHLSDENAMFDMEARLAVQRATGREIYAYFEAQLDEHEARPTDDILTHFVTAEIDGQKLFAPRRSSISASCSSSPASTQSAIPSRVSLRTWPHILSTGSRSLTTRRSSPRPLRSCCAGSRRCPAACPASPPRTRSSPTAPWSPQAPRWSSATERATSIRAHSPTASRCGSTARRTVTSPSAVASTAAWDHTSRAPRVAHRIA